MEQNKEDFDGFNIESPAMKRVFSEVADYAVHGYPLILFGPTGTGKEFLAKYYHKVFCRNKIEYTDFNSLNCAGLSKETAISELFGHVKGAFTGATKDKPGIFETTNGVLFLDEFGDIHPEVQAMLLRAVDAKIREGKRLGANEPYKIENVIVIAATEQPKEKLRESLLARMGAEINVPGINKRKEDIPSALSYFFRKALLEKRCDSKVVISTLIINRPDLGNGNNVKTKIISEFSTDLSRLLTPSVEARDWQGNFRSVGNVANQAVIRAKKINSYYDFLEDVKSYFIESCKNFSSHIYPEFDNQFVPEEQTESNIAIQHEWYSVIKAVFPNIHEKEVRKIAGFFSQYDKVEFTRENFHDYLGETCGLRTAQLRLKELTNQELLTIKKRGNKNFYNITPKNTVQNQVFLQSEFLALPKLKKSINNRNKELEELNDIIINSHGIFLSGPKQSGKTTLAIVFCAGLKRERPVYYFSFKQGDIEELLILISNELKNDDSKQNFQFNLQDDISIETKVAFISGYLNQYIYAERKPLLILDETDLLTTQNQQLGLQAIIRFWHFFDVMLVGEKMGNETAFENFVEYKIS